MTRYSAIVILAALATISSFFTAHSQSLFDRLVMPGELAQSHAKYEKTCENCHEPFSKDSQRRLCLDCHKEVATDVNDKTGFHGKRSDIAVTECKTCHTDHKGRPADIVQFDPQTFNHTTTDFQLTGAHATAPCSGCHASGEKFRKAPQICIGCHKKNDVHNGELGKECATCHTDTTWQRPKAFDHAKTKFPLIGAHEKVQCAVCHVGERYRDLPHTCNDCHRIQDIHAGRFGAKCQTCHTSSKWNEISFDHGKSTKFPLNGAHKAAKCTTCHKGVIADEKLTTACVGCHKANDPHKGQLGQRCEQCHNEINWRQKVKFDHDVTAFPLIGLHATVPCEECHQSTAHRDAAKTCAACHKDTHHEGKLGPQCQRCHNPNGWALWRFNHDRETKFPLAGAHAGLQCQGCHREPTTNKVTAPSACFACHASDDAHRGTFGRGCDKCHVTTSFRDGLRSR